MLYYLAAAVAAALALAGAGAFLLGLDRAGLAALVLLVGFTGAVRISELGDRR